MTIESTQRELDIYHIDLPNKTHANENRTVYNTGSEKHTFLILIIIIIIIMLIIIYIYIT